MKTAHKAKRRRVRMWCRLTRRSRQIDTYWSFDLILLQWLEGKLDPILQSVYRIRLPERLL